MLEQSEEQREIKREKEKEKEREIDENKKMRKNGERLVGVYNMGSECNVDR